MVSSPPLDRIQGLPEGCTLPEVGAQMAYPPSPRVSISGRHVVFRGARDPAGRVLPTGGCQSATVVLTTPPPAV